MEESNVMVTEMNNDGSVEISYVPASEFNSAEHIPAQVEEKSGFGTVMVGAAAVVGVGTAIYGAVKGIKKLARIYKAGVAALAEEDIDVSEIVECSVEPEPEVREFIDKTEEENKKRK